MSNRPAVTVLIPTCNAGAEFPANLRAMHEQEVDRRFEVLVIDSGSTDGTVEFLRSASVRLIEIEKSAFNHGQTRQLGIEEAHGDLVVLTTQDARPADCFWMQQLVNCLYETDVAGAYSRQTPRPDANPFVRDRLNEWAASDLEPREQRIASLSDYGALPPLSKVSIATFDNVSSCVRRNVALAYPFRSMPFGEDIDWAYRVLLDGYRIVYEPRSCVIHSHNRSIWYEMRRVYLHHQLLCRMFGVQTIERHIDILRCTVQGSMQLSRVVANDAALTTLSRLKWWARIPPYVLAQNLAQHLGARSSRSDSHSLVFRLFDRLAQGV